MSHGVCAYSAFGRSRSVCVVDGSKSISLRIISPSKGAKVSFVGQQYIVFPARWTVGVSGIQPPVFDFPSIRLIGSDAHCASEIFILGRYFVRALRMSL